MGAVLPGLVPGLPLGQVLSEAQSAVITSGDGAALCLVSVVGPPLAFKHGDPVSHSPSAGLGPRPRGPRVGAGVVDVGCVVRVLVSLRLTDVLTVDDLSPCQVAPVTAWAWARPGLALGGGGNLSQALASGSWGWDRGAVGRAAGTQCVFSAPDPAEHGVCQAPAGCGRPLPKPVPQLHR